jgi:hypothetical protein
MITLAIGLLAANTGALAAGTSSDKSCGFDPLFRAESAANGDT